MIQLRWVKRTRMIHDGGFPGSAVGQSYDVLQQREPVAYAHTEGEPTETIWSDWVDVPHEEDEG